jgi:hypothetical protein
VSYELNSKNEARKKLEELGIDSVGDVRRANGAYRRDIPAVIAAEQLTLQSHGSPGSMTASVDDLTQISGHISTVRDDVHDVLGVIRQLGGHQFDGWGPIADRMAAGVSDRVGPDVGAEHALASYLAELADLDAVLTQTAVLYAGVEQNSVEQLRRAARGDA